MTVAAPTFDLVVAANRLPVERVVDASGGGTWHRSPGGLVTAVGSVMRGRDAAWVGWAGEPGPAAEPFSEEGMHLHPVGLSPVEVQEYYEGFSNETLWPIYHDVIVPATFHRAWWNTYRTVNHRFAKAVAEVAAPGATVWVHDYQLQLVPAMIRAIRPDVRIGWFNHIPFPPVELFAQLPWRRHLVEGLLGADFLGFQRTPTPRTSCAAVGGCWAWRPKPTRSPSHRPATTPPRSGRCGPPRYRYRWTSAGSTSWPAHPRWSPERRRSVSRSATLRSSCSALTGSTTPRGSGTG